MSIYILGLLHVSIFGTGLFLQEHWDNQSDAVKAIIVNNNNNKVTNQGKFLW